MVMPKPLIATVDERDKAEKSYGSRFIHGIYLHLDLARMHL